MLFHLSTLAIILLVVYLFHRYQLVSDHLLPFLRSKGLLQPAVGYNRLSSFAEQSGAGVRPPSPSSPISAQRSRGWITRADTDWLGVFVQLSSSNFDLEANNAGDSREGLDPEGAAEVQRIMREEGCSFDEVRFFSSLRTALFERGGWDPFVPRVCCPQLIRPSKLTHPSLSQQARLRRHRRILARNGADATGMPTDSKAITSLSR